MMISPIGNDRRKKAVKGKCVQSHGLTLVEVMLTVVILVAGILVVYQVFLHTLSTLQYLNTRMYAQNLLMNNVEEFKLDFQKNNQIYFGPRNLVERVLVGNKIVDFRYFLTFAPVRRMKDLYQLDASVIWKEGSRDQEVSQTVFLTKPSSS